MLACTDSEQYLTRQLSPCTDSAHLHTVYQVAVCLASSKFKGLSDAALWLLFLLPSGHTATQRMLRSGHKGQQRVHTFSRSARILPSPKCFNTSLTSSDATLSTLHSMAAIATCSCTSHTAQHGQAYQWSYCNRSQLLSGCYLHSSSDKRER